MKLFRKLELVMIFIVFTVFITSSFAADTLKITSPTYFGEQNVVYEDINYLENEILSFEFCSADDPTNIEFNLICNTDADMNIDIYENYAKKGCFFSNFELSKSNCKDFALEIEYTAKNKEKKFKRTFKQQKQSKLINHVLNLDYNLLTPVDLSYFLIVLNDIESSESQTSLNAYEKLKTDRNNNNKCWPKDACDITKTANVLRNLKFAGYSTSSRLMDDGKNYLQKSKISNSNNPTPFTITVTDTYTNTPSITCSLSIDGGTPINYLFNSLLPTLTKYASSSINFNCNQSVNKIVLKLLAPGGIVKDTITQTNTNGVSKTIPDFSCIGDTSCDFGATINALMAYGTSIESSSLMDAYLKSLIITVDDDETQYLNTGNVFENTGKYLYYASNSKLTDYLKFNQNNVGSWGDKSLYDIIKQTAWAVIGLQKVSASSEYVVDGKKWIYFNEPETGWGNIEKNTLAYIAIKEQIKPYLKITAINEIEETTKFLIENPTTHNLKDIKISLSPNLNDYVSYTESLGDLDGDETIEFEILVNNDFYSQLTGEIVITGVDGKNVKQTLITLPVNLKGPSPITLIGGNYSITEEVPIVYVKLHKNIPQFAVKCTYKNPFDESVQNIELTQDNYDFGIHNSVYKEGNFDLKLSCSYGDTTFNLETELVVDIAKVSFKTIDELTLTDLDDFSFFINDTSNDKQTLTFIIEGHYAGLVEPAEKSKLLAKGDTRDLFFTITNPVMLEAYGNNSMGSIIIKSSSGYMKKIPVTLNLGSSEDKGMGLGMKIFLTFIILFIGLIIYRFYEMKIHEKQGGNGGGSNHPDDEEFFFE